MFDDILNAFRAQNESGRAHTKKQPGIQLNSWVGSLDWIFNLIGCARTQNLSEESAQKLFWVSRDLMQSRTEYVTQNNMQTGATPVVKRAGLVK